MPLLPHVRHGSYETLEREVRADLVYRSFCRMELVRVPDAKTLVRLGQTAGPEVIEELQARIVALAQKKRIVRGRSTRVDTTVVKTNVHDLTDSSLLGDGARVLTRTMKEVVAQKRDGLKTKIRDRMRTVPRRVLEIGLAARQKGLQGEERNKGAYRRLLTECGRRCVLLKGESRQLHKMGVHCVAVPNCHTRSQERKRRQRRPWFQQGQRWRTGCEGGISVLKRRDGLSRCRYHGLDEIQRWVGLGVIADNLASIGNV